MAKWMNSTGGVRLLEIAVHTNLSPEAVAYEESIVGQLKIIDKTAWQLILIRWTRLKKFGLCRCMKKLQNICGCVGVTVGVLSPKQGGGIVGGEMWR